MISLKPMYQKTVPHVIQEAAENVEAGRERGVMYYHQKPPLSFKITSVSWRIFPNTETYVPTPTVPLRIANIKRGLTTTLLYPFV